MPDLSEPLNWPEPKAAARPDRSAAEGFAWPTPPFGAYPQPQVQLAPEPCEILGLNNSRSSGQVISLSPQERLAQIHVPPARSAMPLKFGQFRALKLLTPLRAEPREDADDEAELEGLDQRPRSEFRLQFIGGGELQGYTIGHQQDELGLFLF